MDVKRYGDIKCSSSSTQPPVLHFAQSVTPSVVFHFRASPKTTQVTPVRRDSGVQLHFSQQSLLKNVSFDSGGEIVPIYKLPSP